eukprot:gene2454-8568_t
MEDLHVVISYPNQPPAPGTCPDADARCPLRRIATWDATRCHVGMGQDVARGARAGPPPGLFDDSAANQLTTIQMATSPTCLHNPVDAVYATYHLRCSLNHTLKARARNDTAPEYSEQRPASVESPFPSDFGRSTTLSELPFIDFGPHHGTSVWEHIWSTPASSHADSAQPKLARVSASSSVPSCATEERNSNTSLNSSLDQGTAATSTRTLPTSSASASMGAKTPSWGAKSKLGTFIGTTLYQNFIRTLSEPPFISTTDVL